MSAKDFPAVSITLNHSPEESVTEPGSDYVVIDFKESENASAGFITLDDPSNLFMLRDAIDSFIKGHDIRPKKQDGATAAVAERPQLTGAETILAQYMGQFVQTDDIRTPGVELKTTDDIINDLSSMCELVPNDVAAILVRAGFRTYHDADGRHGWMLVRLISEVPFH